MAEKFPSFDELLKEAVGAFEETFNCKPEIAACAPGLYCIILPHNLSRGRKKGNQQN